MAVKKIKRAVPKGVLPPDVAPSPAVAHPVATPPPFRIVRKDGMEPSQNGEDTLQSVIFEARSQTPQPTVEIDITPYLLGRDPSKPAVILRWKKPSVPLLYRVANEAAELEKRNPRWTPELAQHVATISSCHVGASVPIGDIAPGLFYAGIANAENAELWGFITRRFGQAYPSLVSVPLDQLVMVDLCAQYYSRHPEELEHLDADILTQLQQIKQLRDAATK